MVIYGAQRQKGISYRMLLRFRRSSMSSDILVRDQIFSTYDSLYDAEKKVADYLISHPSEAIEMSVSELASHCDASQATIIRFCKKIDVRDFIS